MKERKWEAAEIDVVAVEGRVVLRTPYQWLLSFTPQWARRIAAELVEKAAEVETRQLLLSPRGGATAASSGEAAPPPSGGAAAAAAAVENAHASYWEGKA